mgnify:CR=1 FL=1
MLLYVQLRKFPLLAAKAVRVAMEAAMDLQAADLATVGVLWVVVAAAEVATTLALAGIPLVPRLAPLAGLWMTMLTPYLAHLE